MLALLFYHRYEREKLSLAHSKGRDLGNLRLTLCERSGFIKCYDLYFPRRLKGRRIFKQYTVSGTNSASYHYRNGGCKSECTGTAYNEHCHRSCYRVGYLCTDEHPNYEGSERDKKHCRNEYSRYFIRRLSYGSLARGCLLDHFYYLKDSSFFPDFYSFDLCPARKHGSRTENAIARQCVLWQRLTCKSGSIDGYLSLCDNSVTRYVITLFNYKYVTAANL